MSLTQRLPGVRTYERRLFVTALLVLLLVRIGLWVLPLRQLQALLRYLAEATSAPQAHPDYAVRVARAASLAATLVPAASCLTQVLTTQMLLRRRGLIGRLRIGVEHGPQGMLATHAWIEYNGQVIIGGTPEDLARLTPFPACEGESF